MTEAMLDWPDYVPGAGRHAADGLRAFCVQLADPALAGPLKTPGKDGGARSRMRTHLRWRTPKNTPKNREIGRTAACQWR